MHSRGNSPRFPSQDEVRPDDIDELINFQRGYAAADGSLRLSIIKPGDRNVSVTETDLNADQKEQGESISLFWPAFALCVPITLLAVALLVLIQAYKVTPNENVFKPASLQSQKGAPFILVDYPATRLVFVASFLSTVAPLLATFVMSLCAVLASRELRDAQAQGDPQRLPTPYQLSLLVGMLAATLDQIRAYLWYRIKRGQKPAMPPVLHRTALVFTISLVLATGVFIADTALHYATSTIEFDQILLPDSPQLQLGRGLSQMCLEFNRTALFGWPCSVMAGFEDPNFYFEQNEAERLAHNSSTLSEIRIALQDNDTAPSVAYLMPRVRTLGQNLDFQATTIGVSTSCSLVPITDCNLVRWGDSNIYTNFSCTDMFHGTLGKAPNVSEVNGDRAPDAYRSFLMYKPDANLMFSFFNDSDMQDIYNTPGYDDSGQLNAYTFPMLDSELVNPFHVAFALRMTLSQFQPDSEMITTESEVYGGLDLGYIDFILNCAVKSYDVEYTWVEGALQNLSATPTLNGSVLEIFHGSLMYITVSGASADLQDFMIQAGLDGKTTKSFLEAYGDLYSTKVLAKIGAYTTGRTVVAEQERQHMLLAKVPVPALGVLLGWSFAFLILGLILAFKAYTVADADIRLLASQLSLLGIVTMATPNSNKPAPRSGGDSPAEDLKKLSKAETMRVGVDRNSRNFFHISSWV